jgi:hypothetical protein
MTQKQPQHPGQPIQPDGTELPPGKDRDPVLPAADKPENEEEDNHK